MGETVCYCTRKCEVSPILLEGTVGYLLSEFLGQTVKKMFSQSKLLLYEYLALNNG